MLIRVVIADDEPLARRRIHTLLSAQADVEVVAECRDGREAAGAVEKLHPDLLFLDIEMPELDGLTVVESIAAEQMPLVIFVTAYDQYAVKAFEANALDYLLKPFDTERFLKSLNRARANLQRRASDYPKRIASVLTGLVQPAHGNRMVVKSGGRIVFVEADEVDWIEAAANYVRIHAGSQAYLLRETMSAMEAKLDPSRYIRIHRSIIVNVQKIRELQPCNNGEYIAVLRTGKNLSVSRSYRDRLQSMLQIAASQPRPNAPNPEL